MSVYDSLSKEWYLRSRWVDPARGCTLSSSPCHPIPSTVCVWCSTDIRKTLSEMIFPVVSVALFVDINVTHTLSLVQHLICERFLHKKQTKMENRRAQTNVNMREWQNSRKSNASHTHADKFNLNEKYQRKREWRKDVKRFGLVCKENCTQSPLLYGCFVYSSYKCTMWCVRARFCFIPLFVVVFFIHFLLPLNAVVLSIHLETSPNAHMHICTYARN